MLSRAELLGQLMRNYKVPVAISGARGLFEARGNRATPGTVYVRVLPPIQTAGMSRAEQKQLPDAVRQTILAEL